MLPGHPQASTCSASVAAALTSGPKPHKALRSPTLPPIYPGAVLVDFRNLAPTAEVDLVRDAGDGWATTPRTWSETAVSNQTEFLTTPNSFGGYSQGWNTAGHQFPRGRAGSRGGEPPRTLRPAVTLRVYAHVLRESASGVADVFAGAIERAAVSKSVSKPALRDDETRGPGL